MCKYSSPTRAGYHCARTTKLILGVPPQIKTPHPPGARPIDQISCIRHRHIQHHWPTIPGARADQPGINDHDPLIPNWYEVSSSTRDVYHSETSSQARGEVGWVEGMHWYAWIWARGWRGARRGDGGRWCAGRETRRSWWLARSQWWRSGDDWGLLFSRSGRREPWIFCARRVERGALGAVR